MVVNYKKRIQELEAKYGWTFNTLKNTTMRPVEIVEYAYNTPSDYCKTWERYD